MTKKTIHQIIAFFNKQIRVCNAYAEQSECGEEFEDWRYEAIALRGIRNYIEWCIL